MLERFEFWVTLAGRRHSGVRTHIVWAPHDSEWCDTDNDVSNHRSNGARFCLLFQGGAALAQLIAD